ncbi:GGDEF domain-containing protein [Virgibacillus halodenitrificans]|jgi:diguanylate cyclase (GGDEF)-like protein|uniref:GGDEF domain-containing protein n=1 Tax=Virgibacillus halodenitrificans TaxID=1482 RepID=UPI00398C3EA9
MRNVRIFIICIFITSIIVAFSYGHIAVEKRVFLNALLLFWLFSSLYSHLNIVVKKGNVNMDHGISYGMAIALFAGPLGLFIFEFVQRFIVYAGRKIAKTADPDEFLHTFYNIGAFTLNNSLAFFLFTICYPYMEPVPFGFWLLIILLVIVVALLSDSFLITIFFLTGELKGTKDAIEFIKSRNVLDMGKTAFSNGLLFILLLEQKWEMIIALFLLNYLVSRSFMNKSKSIKNKMERDKFEQMAYTDFLTNVHNRAFMDKKMSELDQTSEQIGIIVADIDTFKRINDTYNHAVGDHVIKHFASVLQSSLTEEDCLFRSGGEEFTIFLRNKTYQQCIQFVNDIREKVERTQVTAEFQTNEITISYTASFGLFYFLTGQEMEMMKAYIQADQLLLHSKQIGKNRVSAKNGWRELPLSAQYGSTP